MNLNHYLVPDSMLPFGPYFHQINKGGLASILETGQLRPSEARAIAGGGVAVRAHTSPDILKNHHGVVIEFRTHTPPRSGSAAWLAVWDLAEHERLRIEVVAIHGVPRPEHLF